MSVINASAAYARSGHLVIKQPGQRSCWAIALASSLSMRHLTFVVFQVLDKRAGHAARALLVRFLHHPAHAARESGYLPADEEAGEPTRPLYLCMPLKQSCLLRLVLQQALTLLYMRFLLHIDNSRLAVLGLLRLRASLASH